MIPQIIWLALIFMSMGLSWEKHGKVSNKPENAWAALISLCLQILILWWGGFFDCFGL